MISVWDLPDHEAEEVTPAKAINVFKDAPNGVVEVDDVVSSFGCSPERAREALEELERQGQIEPVSPFRDDAWHLVGEEVPEPGNDRSVEEERQLGMLLETTDYGGAV